MKKQQSYEDIVNSQAEDLKARLDAFDPGSDPEARDLSARAKTMNGAAIDLLEAAFSGDVTMEMMNAKLAMLKDELPMADCNFDNLDEAAVDLAGKLNAKGEDLDAGANSARGSLSL